LSFSLSGEGREESRPSGHGPRGRRRVFKRAFWRGGPAPLGRAGSKTGVEAAASPVGEVVSVLNETTRKVVYYMRFISRSAVGALTAVVAMSAIAAVSAMATPAYFIEGKAITANETISATSGTSTLTSSVAGTSVEIVSTKSKGTGSISPGGKSTYSVSFEGNSVKAPAGCRLTEAEERSITTVAMPGQLQEDGINTFLAVFGNGNDIVISFEKCQNNWWNGAHTVTGSAGATMAGVEAVEQPASFTSASQDDLTWLGGYEFTLTSTENVKLSGVNKGKKFGINI
jgi:hypothetical protein